jgi:hypothetical protein
MKCGKQASSIRSVVYPCQDERRDANVVKPPGQEVDHGRLPVAAPGEVADTDDGDREGAPRA